MGTKKSSTARLSSAIPTFPVRVLDEAVVFYAEKLGFETRYREGGFAAVVRDDVELHLTELNDESWRTRDDFRERPVCSGAESFLPGTHMCRVRVEDVQSLFDEMEPLGVVHPRGTLTDQWWGDRDFSVLDQDRNLIVFFQKGAVARREP